MGIDGIEHLKPTFNEDVKNLKDTLRKAVAEHTVIDIGNGVAKSLGVSEERFRAAIIDLKIEGYQTHSVGWHQQSTGNKGQTKVLAAPGSGSTEINRFIDKMPRPNKEENNATQ